MTTDPYLPPDFSAAALLTIDTQRVAQRLYVDAEVGEDLGSDGSRSRRVPAARCAAARARSLLVRLSVCLCVGAAVAVVTLLVCFASGTPMATQERIATEALLMVLVGGILFAIVYTGGDDPLPPDDGRSDSPDDPGGDEAYPWWVDFERELRDYERERSREGERART